MPREAQLRSFRSAHLAGTFAGKTAAADLPARPPAAPLPSADAQRSWIALVEKGLPFKIRKVDLNNKDEEFVSLYRSINPDPDAAAKVSTRDGWSRSSHACHYFHAQPLHGRAFIEINLLNHLPSSPPPAGAHPNRWRDKAGGESCDLRVSGGPVPLPGPAARRCRHRRQGPPLCGRFLLPVCPCLLRAVPR